MKSAAGFTLVELMVVVAVLAIVITLAIPVSNNARINANEGSAVGSMRTFVSSNETYRTRFGSYASAIQDLADAGIIDERLASAIADPGKAGYVFTYNTGPDTYTVLGTPFESGRSGIRHFYVDPSGVIRFADSTRATSVSTPID